MFSTGERIGCPTAWIAGWEAFASRVARHRCGDGTRQVTSANSQVPSKYHLQLTCHLSLVSCYLFDDSLSLSDRNDLIGDDALKGIDAAARPPDFEPVGALIRSQPEVLAHVVLTEIAGSRLHLANLRTRSCRQAQTSPDTVTVALLPDQPHQDRVAVVAVV